MSPTSACPSTVSAPSPAPPVPTSSTGPPSSRSTSAALDAMRQSTEADLGAPEFRKNLALKIRDEMNAVLVKYEDFGGIEEVFFTSFVVQ